MVSNLVGVLKGYTVNKRKIIIFIEDVSGLRRFYVNPGLIILLLIISYMLIVAGAVWLTFSLTGDRGETAKAFWGIIMENDPVRKFFNYAIVFILGIASTLVGTLIAIKSGLFHYANGKD